MMTNMSHPNLASTYRHLGQAASTNYKTTTMAPDPCARAYKLEGRHPFRPDTNGKVAVFHVNTDEHFAGGR
mgnify:FL=1